MRFSMPFLGQEGSREELCRLALSASANRRQLCRREPARRARAISLMAWFFNTVHPNFTHIGRPQRFATDTSVHEHLEATGRENVVANLREIDGLLAGKTWIPGDGFGGVDGFALVLHGWGKRIGLPVAELKNYTAWKDRMLARPAMKRALEREQSVLLAAQPARRHGRTFCCLRIAPRVLPPNRRRFGNRIHCPSA